MKTERNKKKSTKEELKTTKQGTREWRRKVENEEIENDSDMQSWTKKETKTKQRKYNKTPNQYAPKTENEKENAKRRKGDKKKKRTGN